MRDQPQHGEISDAEQRLRRIRELTHHDGAIDDRTGERGLDRERRVAGRAAVLAQRRGRHGVGGLGFGQRGLGLDLLALRDQAFGGQPSLALGGLARDARGDRRGDLGIGILVDVQLAERGHGLARGAGLCLARGHAQVAHHVGRDLDQLGFLAVRASVGRVEILVLDGIAGFVMLGL